MRPFAHGVAYLLLMVCCVCHATIRVNTISPGWEDKKADIYFLLSSASSMWSGDLKVVKDFVADLVKGMDLGPEKTRVGLGLFSTEFRPYLSIDNKLSKDDLMAYIKGAPYTPGASFMSRGIQGIRQVGLAPNVTRKGVPQIGVILTDGESRYRQLNLDNSTLAKKAGMYFFTVGMGRSVDRTELRTISSDPKDDYAFMVSGITPAALGGIKQTLMKNMASVEILQSDEGTCGKKVLTDVIFVFNEYTLGQQATMAVKKFIRSLVREFSMDSGNVRAAIVADPDDGYNRERCPKRDTTLGRYLTQEKFLAYLDSQTYPTTSTLLKRARLAHQTLIPEYGARRDAKKRIVLFLHGQEPLTFRLRDEARRVKFRRRIEMSVVMMGITADKESFKAMASDPSYVTDVSTVDQLQNQKESFMETFCQELN